MNDNQICISFDKVKKIDVVPRDLQEVKNLKSIDLPSCDPLHLLKTISKIKLDTTFPNVCIALIIS